MPALMTRGKTYGLQTGRPTAIVGLPSPRTEESSHELGLDPASFGLHSGRRGSVLTIRPVLSQLELEFSGGLEYQQFNGPYL